MLSNDKIFLILIHFVFFTVCDAQIGIGTETPHSSAIVDVSSDHQGFLPPRLTIVERNNISEPANGLMIYCKNCCQDGTLSVYNSEKWKNMPDCSHLDNDDDGIFNDVDIDDDNDGILDRFEDCVNASSKAYYHTSTKEYVKYDIHTGDEEVQCSTANVMGDMAIDKAGDLFGIRLSTNPSEIVKIDKSNCSEQLVGSVPGLSSGNSFSFLLDGSALVGGAGHKKVYRITSFAPFASEVWHTFNDVKGPAGDFVIINGRLYISFVMPNSKTHLYEVIYNDNLEYVSHSDLGEIPNTYGFSVVQGRIFSFYGNDVREVILGTPPQTQVVYNTPYFLYGGTALDEVFGDCHSANKDIDGDGIPNRFDLDSDNDGCSDAFESGITMDAKTNYNFSHQEVGENGLVNSIESEDSHLGTLTINGIDTKPAYLNSANCN
jgi:hypothetical protein